jgi:hypothetical protein
MELQMEKKCGEPFGIIRTKDQAKLAKGIRYEAVKADDPRSLEECIGRDCSHKPGGNEKNSCQEQADGSFKCEACLTDGKKCQGSGPNDRCCTGFCMNGICGAGQPGDPCEKDRECISGICETNFINSCSTGLTGSPCASDNECAKGYFCYTEGRNYCSPGTKFSRCEDDNQCQDNLRCLDVGVDDKLCLSDSNDILVVDCVETDKIPHTGCNQEYPYCNETGADFCHGGNAGAPCEENIACKSGYCDTTGQNVCTDGKIGEACDDSEDCQSKFCYTKGDFGVCTSGEMGKRCDTSRDCKQGLVCNKNFVCGKQTERIEIPPEEVPQVPARPGAMQ